jgi:acyl-CoA synthetase (AMP-forming)/AMP-acid ligase II
VPGWNFADVWDAVAESIPDAPALVHGDRRVTWGEMDRRANRVAQALLDAGLGHQDKVAQYLHNCPEYTESVFATYKAGLVPVNTNYRYTSDELLYLWDNADAEAIVFGGTFGHIIDEIRDRLPKVRLWLWVDDGGGPCPDWAQRYEEAASSGTGPPTLPPWGRDGDDILMLYTGGTTGMPKGVMWRQDDLFSILNAQGLIRHPEEPDYDAVRAAVTQAGPVFIPACPLMHGTGLYSSFSLLDIGGSIVTLGAPSFDVVEFLDAVERERVNATAIVGDAFAKPILRALDAEPERWDISSLFLIVSSGVMWSQATKEGLLRHNPNLLLSDQFSSSEAIGMGSSVSNAGNAAGTASFRLGENAAVITDDGRLVEAGSGEIGKVGVKGRVPLGYYKDPEKSAATFPDIDGVRYSIPGDYATVDADGTIRLLGRGSVCINTGGEKVYPEEVEEALKTHPAVRDAVAVGVPDEKWGEMVTALVEPGEEVDESELIAHVKQHLASYKAPKHVLMIDSVERAPNGKVDYKRLRDEAIKRLATT